MFARKLIESIDECDGVWPATLVVSIRSGFLLLTKDNEELCGKSILVSGR